MTRGFSFPLSTLGQRAFRAGMPTLSIVTLLTVVLAVVVIIGSQRPVQELVPLTSFNPVLQTERVQIDIPLARFDLWYLPNAAELASGTPLDLWVTTAGSGVEGIILGRAATDAIFVQYIQGVDDQPLVTIEIAGTEINQITTWVGMDAADARLIALPSLDRQAPNYVLSESDGRWLTTPENRLFEIPRSQIEFTSTDLQIGDVVTLNAVDNTVQPVTIEPITTDAILIMLPSQSSTSAIVQVRSSISEFETRLTAGRQFSLLETPGIIEEPSRFAYIPHDSSFSVGATTVFDTPSTVDAMRGCAIVDVTGVFVSMDTESGGITLEPSLRFTALAQNVRVLAAPEDEDLGWLLEMADSQQAMRLQSILSGGDRIYLSPACT